MWDLSHYGVRKIEPKNQVFPDCPGSSHLLEWNHRGEKRVFRDFDTMWGRFLHRVRKIEPKNQGFPDCSGDSPFGKKKMPGHLARGKRGAGTDFKIRESW
jgi:hypothetical protein